jgi:hypothetical protein
MSSVWSRLCGVQIPLQEWCIFLATCNMFGVPAYLGVFGPKLEKAAMVCWLVYFLGALYTRHVLDDSLRSTLGFLAVLVGRAWSSKRDGGAGSTEEKRTPSEKKAD